MNISSQILFAILITSVSGTIALAVWWILSRSRFRWNLDLMYLMLRLVCLLYLIPAGYGLMQVTVRGYVQMPGLWQVNFLLTGVLWILGAIVGILWFALMVSYLVSYLSEYRKLRKVCERNVPEEDKMAREEFLRIKAKLGIRRNIRLFRNDGISSPMILGVFRCSVVLPTGKYSREQLCVIFYHELTHYKSNDNLFKLCSVCIAALHHLNPVTGKLIRMLNEWSEFHCDAYAIAALGDEMDSGRYFEVIIDSVKKMPCENDGNYIFSMLCEDQLNLERRIEYMKKYETMKKATKGATAFLAFAFVLMSVTTTYAAGSEMAGLHDELYQRAEVTDVQDDGESKELEEMYLPASEDNSYAGYVYANPELEVISPLLDSNTPVAFNWNVSSGVRMVSNAFHVDAGQTISIAAVATPSTSLFWIGVQDQWNNVRYVQGYSSLAYDFPITSSGSYRILVQNKSSVAINAVGSYYYH